MGTLQALMPNGAVIEREMSRANLYTHGLAMNRGLNWALISVHRSHATASQNMRRLSRSFSGGQAFEECPEISVVELSPKVTA